ncbi:hypothetical protein AB0F88_22450 [Streptosporangium sp. NPDC023963]|uniref:hypothetical protein n=1 Tax=Streptosporangium sp. NPDC023963 TaxID=3155608 RepID=UPI003446B19B
MLRHTRQATAADVCVHLSDEVKRGAADSTDGILPDLTKRRGGEGVGAMNGLLPHPLPQNDQGAP